MTWWQWSVGLLLLVVVVVLAFTTGTLRSTLAVTRREAEQLRGMVKARVERPNVFSHEVRTPLTLIKGAAELMADESAGALTERQRDFVETIRLNAEQVISLAEDLLTEARIDAQLFELHLERVDLAALVRHTVRDARRIHSARIRLDDRGAQGRSVVADERLLAQAVWNLVNNACRHAGESASVLVGVTIDEGQAIITVSDDGAGMTGSERAGLFEPFSVGGSTSGGTGLGMMITDRIIAQHGGKLLVDTVPDRGTSIFLTIPTGTGEGDHGAFESASSGGG